MIIALLSRRAPTFQTLTSKFFLSWKPSQPPQQQQQQQIVKRNPFSSSSAFKSGELSGAAHDAQIISELNQKLAENKLKNIMVYSSDKEGSLPVNVMGCVAGLLLFAASWSTWHLFSSTRFRSRKLDNETGLFKAILSAIGSEYFKIGLCGSIFVVGAISIVGSLFLTMRSVNKLYLLKGGKSLGVVTDGVLGKKMNFVLALNETNFASSRRARSPQVMFKNKNHYFYFIMNNVNCTYHEKALFDHVICTAKK